MLKQDQIDFFHANAFLVMRGMFRGEELKRLTDAVNAVQSQGVAGIGANHLYSPGPDGQKVYWRSERVWEREAIFQAVTVHPDLLENIGQCTGHSFFPWNDSLVVKLAGAGAAVPFHQDPPYGFFKTPREISYPVPNFTTDIYLDHSGPDNGCVYAIPAHHLVGTVDLKSKTEEQLFSQCGAIPLEMEAGDVLFHCLSTPHGSRPNTSPRQRRIFYIHYLADEVFQDAYASTGADWVKEKPGWGESKRGQIGAMIDARRALGFDSPLDRSTLRWGEGGFNFHSAPTTPPRHWATLTARIPPEQRAAMKELRLPCSS